MPAKLVRDRIPEIIVSKGEAVSTYIASEEEYVAKLREKLVEEAQEFLVDPSLEELADVLEVTEAIKRAFGFDEQALEKVRLTKRKERGGFEKKIILES